MTKFKYDDIVEVIREAPAEVRPGYKAWIVGIVEDHDRRGKYFKSFPEGVIYTIEFEDGESVDVHESLLFAIEE